MYDRTSDSERTLIRDQPHDQQFARQQLEIMQAAVDENGRQGIAGLLGLIASDSNLISAWNFLRDHGGATPGPDGVTYGDLAADEIWHLIRCLRRELLDETYRPGPERVIHISKGSGRGTRPLVLQNIADRVVQRAILQVVSPLLDGSLSDGIFGGRPGRGVQSALAQAHAIVAATGRTRWICQDLRDCFEHVPHRRLLDCFGKRVMSTEVNGLLRRVIFNNAGRGVRQGASLSPLLVNLFLDIQLFRPWRRKCPGIQVMGYIDDLLIMCDSPTELARAQDLLEELVRSAGMLLKFSRDEAAHDLGAGATPDWLGYTCSADQSGLHFSLPTAAGSRWLEKLADKLATAHEQPGSTFVAYSVVEAIANQLGPVGPPVDIDAVYAAVKRTAAAAGFEELPFHARFKRIAEKAAARWEACKAIAADREALADDGQQVEAPTVGTPVPTTGRHLRLFTHGCYLRSNRAGGWAYILEDRDGQFLKGRCANLRRATNSRAELTAIITGLLATELGCRVEIMTNSQYAQLGLTERLVRWHARGWRTASGKPVANVDLWKELRSLTQSRHVTCRWIRGLDAVKQNEACDRAARSVAGRLAPEQSSSKRSDGPHVGAP